MRSVGWRDVTREERAELTGHLDEHHHRAGARVSEREMYSLPTSLVTHEQPLELCWQVCHPAWDMEIADNEHEHGDGGTKSEAGRGRTGAVGVARTMEAGELMLAVWVGLV